MSKEKFPEIDVKKYLKNSLVLNAIEIDIYNKITPYLPNTVIDFHSHSGLKYHAKYLDPFFYNVLNSTYPYFSLKQHEIVNKVLWGQNRNIIRIVFAFPLAGINIAQTNRYNYQHQNSQVIPFLAGNRFNLPYTIKEITSCKWRGLKMYHHQSLPRARTIKDFYPEIILKTIEKYPIPIIVHLPNNLYDDAEELVYLAKTYPLIKFVIPHTGNLKSFDSKLPKLLGKFSNTKNIFLDTSCAMNSQIIASIIRILGENRLIFGTDQPINLIRGVICFHSHLGYRIATDTDYHWADPKEQNYYKKSQKIDLSKIPNFHFSSIKAILDAINSLLITNDQKKKIAQKIFYQNALEILKDSF